MRRLRATAAILCGAASGYLLAGFLMVAVLLVSGVDEDDERFLLAVVITGTVLMVVGGLLGWRVWRVWRVWRRRSNGPVPLAGPTVASRR